MTGIAPGSNIDTASDELAKLFNVTPTQAREIISNGSQVVKRGITLTAAAQYETALQQCGVVSVVEVEAAETGLTLDLDKPSPSSETPEFQEEFAQSSSSLARIALALSPIVLVMVIYSFWVGLIPNPFASDNLLEKSLYIGKSTRTDFLKLKESGGIDVINSWRGFRAFSSRVEYNSDETLAAFSLQLEKQWPGKKTASIASLKDALSGVCSSNWTPNQFGNGAVSASDDKPQCMVLEERDGRINVTMAMPQRAAVVPHPVNPAPPPVAQVAPSETPKAKTCLDLKIEEFHKAEPGSPVMADTLTEWEAECAAKKS